MKQKKSQKPSTTEPKAPDEVAENDGEMTDEEFKEWSDNVAREMCDSLNKHAGEHEDGRVSTYTGPQDDEQ